MASTDLNLEVCKKVGSRANFNRDYVQRVMNGDVILPPHPVWKRSGKINWDADPYQDKNWRFQFHMLRWIDSLRWAAEKGDTEALDQWINVARSWYQNNPPSTRNKRNSWMDMQDGLRAIYLISALPEVAEHSPDDLQWLGDCLQVHAEWLADERHLGHSNHALHQHQGLVSLGAVLGDQNLIDLATKRLHDLFSISWDDEGINSEGAIVYHQHNRTWWNTALSRFKAAGVDVQWGNAALEETPIELVHATRPDGRFAPIGDTDGGNVSKINHPACKWITTGGAEGTPPEDLFKIYKSGYVYGHSGWGEFERNFEEETFFSLTFGNKKVHGHDDGSSLIYSSQGVNWITDPGKYSYTHGDPFRKHVIAHSSHSLTYLEGEERSKEPRVSLERSTIESSHLDLLFKDLGYIDQSHTLTRRFIYSTAGEYAIVIDNVRTKNERTAVQRWQLGADVSVDRQKNFVYATKDDQKLLIANFGFAPDFNIVTDSQDECDGYISGGWKKKVLAPVILASKTGTQNRFITAIVPGHKGHPDARRLPGLPTGTLGFRISNGRMSEIVVIRGPQVEFYPGDYELKDLQQELQKAAKNKEATRDKRKAAAKNFHLKPASRKHVFDTIRTCKEAAYANPSLENRKALAQQIISMPEFYTDVDLGLRATVVDLLQRKPKTSYFKNVRAPLINWSGDDSWRATNYKVPICSHRESWDETRIHFDEPTQHTLDLGDLVLPAYFIPGDKRVLNIGFQGAIDRAKISLPFYQYLRSFGDAGIGSTLVFSDPTLDLSSTLRLGWYLGTENSNLYEYMTELVRIITDKFGINETVIRGASGGGFAALKLAEALPDSVVLVNNPQTQVERYLPRAARLASQTAFGRNIDQLGGEKTLRTSALNGYKQVDKLPRIRVYMNEHDKLHIDDHVLPLLRVYENHQMADRFEIKYYDNGPGHQPFPLQLGKQALLDVYRELTASK